jgi:hypothetical protein
MFDCTIASMDEINNNDNNNNNNNNNKGGCVGLFSAMQG